MALKILLLHSIVMDLLILVIRLNKVFKNSTRLPDRETCIGILDSWSTPIGVDADIQLLCELGVCDDPEVIWNTEFFAYDGDL